MQTVTRLAISNNKENRSKSILVMLTIFMTTILLTAIAIFGYGLVKWNHENAGVLYGDYYGTFRGITEEQIETMRLRSEFTDIGKQAIVGIVESEKSLSLNYLDDSALSMGQVKQKLTEGSFPTAENEITAQPSYFKMLGIENPKVGDTVTISYRPDLSNPYTSEKFVISGLIKEPENTESVNPVAYVSEVYYEKHTEKDTRSYTVMFKLDESVKISADTGEEVIKALAEKCGIDEQYASGNYAYLMWALDPGTETIMVCAAIILLVILFSVMVIYNIFQVGIVRKIQEYGKIKALGATKKQMRRLIFMEGISLAVFAIPAGLIVGFGIARVLFSAIMNMGVITAAGAADVSLLSPMVLAVVCLIAILTVCLALKKPMRIVAAISPVEAIRYQENSRKKAKRGIRSGKKQISTWGLTAANLSANKRRTVATIFTMGLSCVLFVVMANFVGNMDAAYDARTQVAYGQFVLSLDYSLNDTAYPENNLDQILLNNQLNEELINEIKSIDGVTGIKTCQVLLMESEWGYETVGVLDEELFQAELEQGAVVGEFDYDRASAEQALIYGWSNFLAEDNVNIGETRNINLSNGAKESELTTPIIGAFGSTYTSWVITEDTYRSLGYEQASHFMLWIDCQEGMEAAVQAALKEQISGLEHLEMTSYQEILATTKSQIKMTQGAIYALTLVIAIISFLNMANTLITSIVTRKQEFGVLQAIGMTNAQLNQSLQMEGMLFTVGTVVVSLAAGIPLGIMLFNYAKEHSIVGIHDYHFPAVETGLMLLAFAALQIALSFILTRNVKKESLIERIRYQG